jgi:hypothetical protein
LPKHSARLHRHNERACHKGGECAAMVRCVVFSEEECEVIDEKEI